MSARIDRIISITKDCLMFVGGMVGIGYQQFTGDVNAILLAIFTAMLGVPGLTNLVSILRGTRTNLQQSSYHSRDSDTDSSNLSD